MDKNTTTGLILIGAVVIAFMYLNKPQEPQKTEQVVTSKSKSKENSETEIDERRALSCKTKSAVARRPRPF